MTGILIIKPENVNDIMLLAGLPSNTEVVLHIYKGKNKHMVGAERPDISTIQRYVCDYLNHGAKQVEILYESSL